jgi:hypothetical protein
LDLNNLISFIKENHPEKRRQVELLKCELDARIYYYGNQFSYPHEVNHGIFSNTKQKIKYVIDYISAGHRYNYLRNVNQKIILSNSYFTINSELDKCGFKTFNPIHSLSVNDESIFNNNQIRSFLSFNKKINNSSFHELLDETTMAYIEQFKKMLFGIYSSMNLSGLIVPNDVAFYEKINLEIFKSLNTPSFIFLHGLPARYNTIDDNQSDYLIVWGEKIKENYVKYGGFNPDKILVSGHPYYKNIQNVNPLRNDFSKILVLSKVQTGSQHNDKIRVQDRANSVYYLLMLESTLKDLGVKNVKLRVHPSENINWYYKFIDKNFFLIDNLKLDNSLKNSSLVIGPTSTVFLEALYYGVNYIVFEPLLNGLDLYCYEPIAPFDKSDFRVEIANSQSELKILLKNKYLVNKSILNDYFSTPFSMDFMQNFL